MTSHWASAEIRWRRRKHGQIDVVFVRGFLNAQGHFVLGLAAGNPGRVLLLSEEEFRADPSGYLVVIAHELGHCLGGYPDGFPDSDGGHVDSSSETCTSPEPEDRHLMCGDSSGGTLIDQSTCKHWYQTLTKPRSPRNYVEWCDGLDNDIDGVSDEGLSCDECAPCRTTRSFRSGMLLNRIDRSADGRLR